MATKKSTSKVVRIKYVLVDVVEFTRDDRTVEDWLQIISALNAIVHDSMKKLELPKRNCILIPTGDGMYICIRKSSVHDIHMKLAVQINNALDLHNFSTDEVGSRFQLRIAVNEHNDLVVEDVNGKSNLAGLGINTTSRIIARCSPGGIIVGKSVYDDTHKFKEYKGRYTKLEVSDKHGNKHDAFAYSDPNNDSPSLISLAGKVKARIGPELTHDDINKLKVGSFVFHKIDRLGRVTRVGPKVQKGQKRSVRIEFNSNVHDIEMNNATGNYCRWL